MCHTPQTSLSAVTATGAGSTIDLQGNALNHTMFVTFTGGPSSVVVNLEGSHDGVTWVPFVGTSGSSTPQTPVTTARVVRYVRANLATLTGGASPTVTATIASV